MPFGKIRGKLSTNRWIPAKTKKDKQQDKKIARIGRVVANMEPKTYTQTFFNMQSNVTVTTSVAVPGTSDTSVIFPISNGLTQGAASTQRVGTEISVVGLSIKLFIYDPTSAGNSTIGDFVRVMLVYDKRYGGTYLNKLSLLETNSVTNQHWDDVLSDYDIDNVDSKHSMRGKNVKILWDKTVIFGRNFLAAASANCSTDSSKRLLVYNKSFKVPKKVSYGTLGGPNQIYMVLCSGPSATTTLCPVVHIVSTMYFRDN